MTRDKSPRRKTDPGNHISAALLRLGLVLGVEMVSPSFFSFLLSFLRPLEALRDDGLGSGQSLGS